MGNQDGKTKAGAGQREISWVSRQRGNYFENTELVPFKQIYLIFMLVCFKSFNVSHDFPKIAVLVQITWVRSTSQYTKACISQTDLFLNKLSR